MTGPFVAYLAIASQAAPLFAVVVWRRRATGPRAWVLAWCAFLLTMDIVTGWLGARGVHNLWLYYVLTPVSGALVLWALSLWQPWELARLTFRLAVVPLLLVWTVLTLAVEDTSAFSQAAEPMAKLVGLGAAAFTLLARSHSASGSLLRHDWFWVIAGMALYFGVSSALSPLSALLVGDNPHLLDLAYQLKAVLDITAFFLIARGMTCQPST